MPLNTFQGMGHSVGLTLTDSNNDPIDPTDANIKNILVYIVSKHTDEVLAQYSREDLPGYELADVETEPGVFMFYVNDEITKSKHKGYYECQVHLEIFDPKFKNSFRTMINKCILFNLNSAHHA